MSLKGGWIMSDKEIINDIECSAVTEVIGRRAFKSREDIMDGDKFD